MSSRVFFWGLVLSFSLHASAIGAIFLKNSSAKDGTSKSTVVSVNLSKFSASSQNQSNQSNDANTQIQEPKQELQIPKKEPIKPKPIVKPLQKTKPITQEQNIAPQIKKERTEDINKTQNTNEPTNAVDDGNSKIDSQDGTKDGNDGLGESNGSSFGTGQNDSVIAPYLTKARKRVQRYLIYPPLAKKMRISGECIVGFTILTDGTIKDLQIIKSSGNATLDDGALRTILKAQPFDRPPFENIQVRIPVSFKVNR